MTLEPHAAGGILVQVKITEFVAAKLPERYSATRPLSSTVTHAGIVPVARCGFDMP